jgi:hypothetical protein
MLGARLWYSDRLEKMQHFILSGTCAKVRSIFSPLNNFWLCRPELAEQLTELVHKVCYQSLILEYFHLHVTILMPVITIMWYANY